MGVSGYILGQFGDGGTFNNIQTGSTGLTPAQRNYSMYELELCGFSWAANKCHHYISNNKYQIQFRTDHSALNKGNRVIG